MEVRSVLIRSGPAAGAIQWHIGQPRETAHTELEQRLQPRPVDVGVVSVDLAGACATEQQPRALTAQVDARAEIDGHRQGRGQRARCRGVDVAARVHDRHVEPGERGDLAGPAAGGVDDVLRCDGVSAGPDLPTAVGGRPDRGHRPPVQDGGAARPGQIDPCAADQMGVDDAVGRPPGRAAEPRCIERRDLLCGVEGQHVDRHPVRALQVDGVQLGRPQSLADQQQVSRRPVPDIDAVGSGEVPESLDAAPGQLDVQVVGPLSADGGERPTGAAGGRTVERLDQHNPVAGRGQLVGAARTDGSGADDHGIRGCPQTHARLRVRWTPCRRLAVTLEGRGVRGFGVQSEVGAESCDNRRKSCCPDRVPMRTADLGVTGQRCGRRQAAERDAGRRGRRQAGD